MLVVHAQSLCWGHAKVPWHAVGCGRLGTLHVTCRAAQITHDTHPPHTHTHTLLLAACTPQDANKVGLSYVRLAIAAADGTASNLTLSKTHYMAVQGAAAAPAKVAAVARVAARGAFNPMTMGADHIIADGVLASSYNDFSTIDAVVPAALRPLLPAAYEALLAGHCAAYRLMGPKAWAALNDRFDTTGLGARKALTATMAAAALAPAARASKVAA